MSLNRSDFENQKILVMGAGKSGIAAVKLLDKAGAVPVLYDENKELDKDALKEKLDGASCDIYAGELPVDVKASCHMLVMSPGIPVDTDFVDDFKKDGRTVIGEIELAYQFAKGRLIGITGTNGKTTTTALTGKIAEDYYGKSFVVGNIGNPYTVEAFNTTDDDITVAEISSFQLETAIDFHPDVTAILNITPDHLNRHHTMENYVACKESITKNQTSDDVCVLNYEDQYLKDFAPKCPARVIWFSSKTKLDEGLYLDGDDICYARNGRVERLMNVHDMKLLGVHNYENVMAAIAMTDAAGIPMDSIIKSVKEFTAVEHRIEYVATVDDVDYYNDSKGTNPDAAIKGIQAMNRQTVLIGGGYDKQNAYDEWIESFNGKVEWLILIGQTKEKIDECAKAHGFNNTILLDTFEEAVNKARELAKPGMAVLLSPACASWGMFPNYEVRGKEFKRMVREFK
ncbi:MAG: UDP-N-acetylmuramoyl-L-alanine--D-glutamate ligase [Lachnospiraceae bacterium]|nr:UDP-N-acetylmuramoyl-L-alanine--D-glutamate ligase [Lachnospiraceae bacterium]